MISLKGLVCACEHHVRTLFIIIVIITFIISITIIISYHY